MSDRAFELTPLTPLGGSSARIETHGPVTLSEVTDTAIASFTARLGHETTAQNKLADFIGSPPPAPGRAHVAAVGAFWTGVDQWMVLARLSSHEDLATRLAECAKGSASVSEQNDAWCRFDLTGQGLADVFERLCPFNYRACQSGEATRTSIDHLGCFLIIKDTDHAIVLGPRSAAGSLHNALLTAMRSAH